VGYEASMWLRTGGRGRVDKNGTDVGDVAVWPSVLGKIGKLFPFFNFLILLCFPQHEFKLIITNSTIPCQI
jgi:hypothetical protein